MGADMAVFAPSPVSRTATEILFLLFKEEKGVSEASILARTLGMTRQAMTGLLDRLEAAGYVVRAPHPDDPRRNCVRLSRRGVRVVADVGGAALRRDGEVAARRTPRQVEAALDFIEGVCAASERDRDRGEPPPPRRPGRSSNEPRRTRRTGA